MAIESSPVAANRDYLLLGGVLAATTLVYLRCLGNGFVWDDKALIILNPRIGEWSFLWKSLTRNEYWFSDSNEALTVARYRPLLLIWLALNYHLWGVNPIGWHATGVVVHLVGVWLAFRISVRLTGEFHAGLFGALLFGLLPGHAEAVAWSAATSNVLSSVLAMTAFLLYTRPGGVRSRDLVLAPLLYGAAMLTHELVVALPGLIGLYSLLCESADGTLTGALAAGEAGRRVGRAILRMAPFAVVLFLYFLLRRYALGFWLSNPDNPLNDATAAQVLMTIPWALTAYLSGVVIPYARFFHNRVLFVRSPAAPEFYLPLAAIAGLGAAFLLAVRNDPRRRLYLFGAGWVLISLAPLMCLFAMPQDTLVPDGYAYLASFGWCMLVGDWLTALGRRRPALRLAADAAGLALAAACAVALWKTQFLFHDDFTLASNCVASFPESYHCHDQLAYLLRSRGDLAGAERELEAALTFQRTDAVALYEKGLLDRRLGQTKVAEQEITASLKLMRRSAPAAGYIALAELYDQDGDQAQADAVLDYARSLPQGTEAVELARARVRMRHGDAAGAEKILRELAAGYPGDYEVWTMLGLLMWDQNRYPDAAAAFAHAVALAPGDARPYFLAARALHRLGRDPEALAQCRQALAIDPANSDAQQLRDQIVATAGRQ